MGRFLELFYRLKIRERILLVVALIVLFYMSLDRVVITPFFKSINETKERLETQKKLLMKYYSFAANKKQFESRLDELEQYYAKLQEKFFVEIKGLSDSGLISRHYKSNKRSAFRISTKSTALKKE